MAFLTKVSTRLALHPRRLVRGLLDGEYASAFAGRSLDFADLRGYVPGDDVKDIDWKSSARTGDLLVKRYVAQRRHTLVVVFPAGRELAAAASPTESKSEIAIMIAGVFGYIASRRGDYVTIVTPGNQGPTAARPSARDVDLERMLVDADARSDLDAPSASMEDLIDFTTGAIRRRSIVLLILDDWQPTPLGEDLLRKLVVRHEVLAMHVNDADPTGAGTRKIVDLDSRRYLASFVRNDKRLADQARAAREKRRQERAELLGRLGVISAEVRSVNEVVPATIRLLKGMRHAARR